MTNLVYTIGLLQLAFIHSLVFYMWLEALHESN